jgi:hypothetical protein
VRGIDIASTGKLWTCDYDSPYTVRSFNGSTWTGHETAGFFVTVRPDNARIVAVSHEGGTLRASFDGGATWPVNVTYNDGTMSRQSADKKWMEVTNETYMTTGGITFHPTIVNRIIFNQGVGVWIFDGLASNTHSVAWQEESTGIEQLVAQMVRIAPAGSSKPKTLHFAVQDRQVFRHTEVSLDAKLYPAVHGVDYTNSIVAGWGIEYLPSNPQIVAAALGISPFLFGMANSAILNKPCYSTDAGETWTLFPTKPAWYTVDGATHYPYVSGQGLIVPLAAGVFLWMPAWSFWPHITRDWGETWAAIELPGLTPISVLGRDNPGWTGQQQYNVRAACADQVIAGRGYIYNHQSAANGGGMWRTDNAGLSWTKVFSGYIGSVWDVHGKFKCASGKAGHIWKAGGHVGGMTDYTSSASNYVMRSTNGGESWAPLTDLTEVIEIGFGPAPSGGTYPSVGIVGLVNGAYGAYRSDDANQAVPSWKKLADWPNRSLDQVNTVDMDPEEFGRMIVGFQGSGFAYGQISSRGPLIHPLFPNPKIGPRR